MKQLCLLLCFFFVISAGCTRDSSSDDTSESTSTTSVPSEGNANIEITDIRKLTTTPKVVVFFKNSGTATAYDLSCIVQVMKNNIVLEEVTVTLTDLPNLELGVDDESLFEFTLSTVDSNDDYDNLSFNFDWNEAYTGNVTLRLSSN